MTRVFYSIRGMVAPPAIEFAMNDIIQKFTEAMHDVGIIPTCPILSDGLLHRAHVQGDRMRSLNLAYVLHLDGKPAGWWQYFKTGISSTWTQSGRREPLTAAMLRQIEEARKARQIEQAKTHQLAAFKAQGIWERAMIVAVEGRLHQYLITKRIKPHGAKHYKNALVIPLMDESGAIANLQFIDPDGSKRFLSGGRKQGCYFTIGESAETILIAEGFATGASLHEATGHFVVVAMDCGNLKPVAEIIRRQHPCSKIIICADHDPVGVEKATIAAFACNGLFIAPPMAGQDFNDFINAGGVVYG